MNKIKYDSEQMKLIALFESMTGAKVKDCIANEKLIFVMEQGEMGKAIGKNGMKIKRMESMLKKKIKLVEFSDDVQQFVKNLIYPMEINSIKNEDGTLTIFGKDTSTKSMLIGREHSNINHLNEIVRRYFDVKEIRVA